MCMPCVVILCKKIEKHKEKEKEKEAMQTDVRALTQKAKNVLIMVKKLVPVTRKIKKRVIVQHSAQAGNE